jgi:hypothetical protein
VSDGADAHEVGSLGAEAARLLGALSGWAGEHAGDAGEGLSGLAAQAAAAAHDLDDHLANGSAECTVCPLCRTIHAMRQLNPEVWAHLTSAAASFAHAVNALMVTCTPAQPRTSDIENIDVTDEWPMA